MQQSDIDRILDAIEEESFLNPTFIASGHGTVADVLGSTPEVQALLDGKNTSLPIMRARYREQDARMADGARLVYFVVFGLARDRQMIKDITSSLKRYRGLPISTLMSPWHPFLHGAKALEQITGSEIHAPVSGTSAKQFDEFVNRVEEWAKTHKDGDHQK